MRILIFLAIFVAFSKTSDAAEKAQGKFRNPATQTTDANYSYGDSCLVQIRAIKSWPDLSVSQSQCVEAEPAFQTCTPILCALDGHRKADLSSQYIKYRAFENSAKEAQKELSAAQDAASRNSALLKLRRIRQDWAAMRDPIDEALGEVGSAVIRCNR